MIVILLQSLTHLSKSYCLSLFKCQFDKEMTEVITTWDAPNRWRILVIFCCYFFFCSSNWRRISRSRRSTRPQKMPWASVSPGSRLRSTNSHPQTRSIINLYWQSHCPTKIWPRHTKSGNSWQGVMNTLQPGHPRTRRRNPFITLYGGKGNRSSSSSGSRSRSRPCCTSSPFTMMPPSPQRNQWHQPANRSTPLARNSCCTNCCRSSRNMQPPRRRRPTTSWISLESGQNLNYPSRTTAGWRWWVILINVYNSLEASGEAPSMSCLLRAAKLSLAKRWCHRLWVNNLFCCQTIVSLDSHCFWTKVK